MEHLSYLKSLLDDKIQRQAVLNEQASMLETLHDGLIASKISRWFGSSYLYVKQVFSFFLGLGLILSSIFVFCYPKVLLEFEMVQKTEPIIRSYFSQVGARTMDEFTKLSEENDSRINIDLSTKNLNEAIDKTVKSELVFFIRFFSFVLFILGIAILYISRLTRKMRLRNLQISFAETQSQDIIRAHKSWIEESENDIIRLQEIITNSSKTD